MTTAILKPSPTSLHTPPQENSCSLYNPENPDLETTSDDSDYAQAFETWNEMRQADALALAGELTPRPTAWRAT